MKLLLSGLLLTALMVSVTPLDLKCLFKNVQTDFGNVFTCLGEEVIEPCPCNQNSTTSEELNIANPEDIPDGKTEEDLEYLYVKDLNITNFPKRLWKKFWKLKGIEFDGTNISDLRSSYFQGLDFLLHVSFPRNKIKKLPGRLFRWNFNIRWVKFEGNLELKNIGFNLFKHLRWLRRVNFAGAGCVDADEQDTTLFTQLASKLFGTCPPDPDDMASDMEIMECTFDNSKDSKESGSKEKSKEIVEDE